MEKEEIITYLESRLEKFKKDEPYAFSIIGSYEAVISDLLNEE